MPRPASNTSELAAAQAFRDRLAYGKYTRWAKDLSMAQIEGILWLVGEFGIRARREDYPILAEHSFGERRKIGSLHALIRSVMSPDPVMTVDEVCKYIRDLERRP